MNASRRAPGVAHSTVPGVGEGVTIRGAVGPETRVLRGILFLDELQVPPSRSIAPRLRFQFRSEWNPGVSGPGSAR
jgi:hypothetical protein